MEFIEKFSSGSGRFAIHLMRDQQGFYSLQKIVLKYDKEEEQFYEVREKPDPSGKFLDYDTAVKESQRILKTFEVS